VAALDATIAEKANAIEDAKRERDPKLLSDQSALQADRETANGAKGKADRELRDAEAAQNQTAGDLRGLRERVFPEVRASRVNAARALQLDGSLRAEIGEFQRHARRVLLARLPVEIEARNGDVQHRTEKRRGDLQRELSGALSRYCQDFHAVLPFTHDQAEAPVVGPWAAAEKQRLDGHELVQYEECQQRFESGQKPSV